MKIKTLKTRNLQESKKLGGCGECQTSCQSACKTSCGVANQPCEQEKNSQPMDTGLRSTACTGGFFGAI